MTIPSRVGEIGDCCFALCDELREVTFESGSELKSIGTRAFLNTAIETIKIPPNVAVMGDWCFYGCDSLREMTFDGIPVNLDHLFAYPNLKLIKVHCGVELPEEVFDEFDIGCIEDEQRAGCTVM
jgi:hypothetical protein